MTLDLTKPVQTRDGRPVRLVATDRKGKFCVVGLIEFGAGEAVDTWTIEGRSGHSSCPTQGDLINVPPKPVKYYTHVYGHPDTRPGNHLTQTTICEAPPLMRLPFIKTIEFEV